MRKLWHDEAWEEYLYWQSQDKKTLKKINRLLTDIDRNGYQCTGKPEPLGENLAGYILRSDFDEFFSEISINIG